MSSEFSCDYCSNMPRHPCHSKKEASTCPNATPGQHLDFDPYEVAHWIRYRTNDEDLLAAAKLIEEKM